MRKTQFAVGEFYHIYNRGVDKRNIFIDVDDMQRFFQSMQEFNTLEPIGSIYEKLISKPRAIKNNSQKLINFICYCLNPNHFHFLVEQAADGGIKNFMHRFSTGYTKYFNERHKRSGSLFEGTYKAIHVSSNEYLLHLSSYVNLNNKVHQLGSLASKTSWQEYVSIKESSESFCHKELILAQFTSSKDYEEFALEALSNILEKKKLSKEMEELLLETLEA